MGSFELASKPKLTFDSWISGEFQIQFEKYMNDNIGCRPFFVRIKNQIYFSLFNKSSGNIVVGKENQLYEKGYINSFYGQDFIGRDSLRIFANQVKIIQNRFKEKNKTLVVVLAPSKARFYSEFIPINDNYKRVSISNYEVLRNEMDLQKLDYVDFNAWFLTMKDTCNCPLFPQHGIHWSNYGSYLALDSLNKYIGLHLGRKLSKIKILSNVLSKYPEGEDYDLGYLLNIFTKLETNKICNPKFTWTSESVKIKPKVVVISDSYFNGIFSKGVFQNAFDLGGFWYYNKEIKTTSLEKVDSLTSSLNLRSEIERNDIFIIMATESNLPKIGWGFLEEAVKLSKEE